MQLRSLLAGISAACVMAGAPAMAQKMYDGVTVNVMTFTGPQIAEPLQRRAPDFEKLTGAKVNVITVPFSDLYTKLLTDWSSGTNSIDAAVFAPQWMVDYISAGLLEDLSDRVANDKDIQEDDVGGFFRDFSQKYDGKIYMITLDGDFHMIYYRTDVLKDAGLEPPNTLDDYLAVAKAVNGKDMNGDGTPDYGSCISKKRNAQAYWFITSIAGGMIQSKGTNEGVFFDTRDMKPLVNNEAFGKALDFLKETTQYGPPNEINLDVGDTRSLFVSGRCALSYDWGDIGTLAIDPATSKVIDKVGAAILPGSKQVLKSGYWQARGLYRGHVPLRGRQGCEPCSVRLVRRLGWRNQRRGRSEGEGRRLRVLLLHGTAGTIERGRHDREDRLQPVPHLAVQGHVELDQGRHERDSRQELSRRHRG